MSDKASTLDQLITSEDAEQHDVLREFNQLYNKYAESVYNYLMLFFNGRSMAEDIFQEVFIKAYKQLIENQGQREISKTWLITVAKNAALDLQKKNVVRREIAQDPENLSTVEDFGPDFVEHLEFKDLQEHVASCLPKLKENERNVFILRNYEQMRYKDIAETLGISERNVKRLMQTAIQKLIYFLEQMGMVKEDFFG